MLKVQSTATFNCIDYTRADKTVFYSSLFEILISFVNWHFLCNNFQIKGLFKYPKKTEITLCQTIMPFHTL